MSLSKTLTVTLTTHGDVDQPCVAECLALALATDGPSVPAALHALARAIEVYDRLSEPTGTARTAVPAQERALRTA